MLKWFIALLLILPSFAEKNGLESFEENPLPTDHKKLEIYRFTYLPTFDKPYLFRIDVADDNSGSLTIKRLSGKGGYELGDIELNKTVPLTGEPYKDLLSKLRNPKVWKPFGDHPENGHLLRGADGELWSLEGLRAGSKHDAAASNPGALPHICTYFKTQPDLEPKIDQFFKDLNPFFQATFSIFEISAPHYSWEKGLHEQLDELRKTSAIFKSPSYRQALEILEREKAADPADPFSGTIPIEPTVEERNRAHRLLKKSITECPDNPMPLLTLAWSYWDTNNSKAAESEIAKARKLAPDDLTVEPVPKAGDFSDVEC